MSEFFKGSPNRLVLFGGIHIGISAVFAVLAVLICMFRKKLSAFGHKRAVGKIMACVLLLNMTVHYSSKIILGIWQFDTDLPFHLCFLTNFCMIYILFTDNKRDFYSIIYYFTFIGPLPAMIWPDLDYSWNSYTFYQFIISHHFMLLCSLYCLLVLDYKVKPKGMIPAFLGGNVLIGAIWVFNTVFDTNYIMMTALPEQLYEIYPFLNALPPIIWLELAGILAILASFFPIVMLGRGTSSEMARSGKL